MHKILQFLSSSKKYEDTVRVVTVHKILQFIKITRYCSFYRSHDTTVFTDHKILQFLQITIYCRLLQILQVLHILQVSCWTWDTADFYNSQDTAVLYRSQDTAVFTLHKILQVVTDQKILKFLQITRFVTDQEILHVVTDHHYSYSSASCMLRSLTLGNSTACKNARRCDGPPLSNTYT